RFGPARPRGEQAVDDDPAPARLRSFGRSGLPATCGGRIVPWPTTPTRPRPPRPLPAAAMNDLRYAVRQLAQKPGFTIVAALTLAIGIGANTALFTIANAVLARPLPGIRDAVGLVWVAPVSKQAGRAVNMSYPDYVDYRDGAGVFAELAAMSDAPFSLSTGGQAERVRGQFVSGNFFATLRTPLVLGRGLTEDDDRAGDPHPVAVISFDAWQERFAGDAGVVGRAILVNGMPFTIVGV